ncbi:MAG: DUF748 domain-containing protein [Planctomycetota bacterium]|nr:DUF748 domain-containing protein [Planctomycetota bacterium]
MLLALLFRLLLIILLPSVLHRVAWHYGLSASYERLELDILGGDVGIWHFSLSPAEGGDPLVQSEYARADISTLALFTGKLTVRRLEAEGGGLLIQRRADGAIPLLQRLAAFQSARTTPTATSIPQKITLTPPLELDVLRLTNFRLRLLDAAVNPRVDTVVNVNMRLTDLDSTFRPTHFEMELSASPILDALHIEGTGSSNGKTLDATLSVALDGLHPKPCAGYLMPIGITPVASGISMRMSAHVTATTRPDNSAAASLLLENITAIADGQEAAALDKFALTADAVNFNTAQIRQLLIEGARVEACRTPQGALLIAGLELGAAQPVVFASAPTPAPTNAAPAILTPPPVAIAPVSAPFTPLHWGLAELALKNFQATLDDSFVTPAAHVAFHLDKLTIGKISPDQPNVAVPVSGYFAAPGIADAIVIEGSAKPFAPLKTLDLQLSLHGIQPVALEPYLNALGLQSDFQNGAFAGTLHADAVTRDNGALTANAKLSNIVLKDQSELLAFNSVDLASFQYDPPNRRIVAKSIEISGPRLDSRRDASGAFGALGFHTKPKTVSPKSLFVRAAAPSSSAPSGATPRSTDWAALLPRIEIGRFAWKDIHVQFDDQKMSPPSSLALDDAGIEVTDLRIDLTAKTHASPGKIHAWVNAPRSADAISVEGTIDPRADGPSIDLIIDGQKISAEKIAPYFKGFAMQPVLQDGNFHLKTHLALEKKASELNGALGVTDLSFKEGPEELIGLDSAEISGVGRKGRTLIVGDISVKSPRLNVSRQADGSVLAAGLRLHLPTQLSSAPDRLGQLTAPSFAGSEINASQPASATTVPSFAGSLSAVVRQFNLHDASVRWTDSAVSPRVSAHLVVNANLKNVYLDNSQKPATVNLEMHEDHALDHLSVTGTVIPSLEIPAARLEVTATGIRAGTLTAYVPPAIQVNLKDGRFHAGIDASVGNSNKGGKSGYVAITDLSFQDGNGPNSLFKLDTIKLAAARVDVPGRVIAIDEISLAGVKTSAVRAADGTLNLLGLTLATPPAHMTQAPATASLDTSTPPPPSVPAAPEVAAIQSGTLAGLVLNKYPLITLDKLDLNISQITFTDEMRPAAAPLQFSNLKLLNRKQIQVLGDDAASRPPVELAFSGAANPLIESIKADLQISPFAEAPALDVDINVSGIRGSGLTDLVPELKPHIDGSTLTDGRFKARFQSAIHRHRADLLDFDLTKGFDLDLSLKGVEYREGPSGPVLAGVEEVNAEGIRIEPRTSTIVARSIEVTNPAANVFRDAAGIHVAGWVVKLPAVAGLPPGAPSALAHGAKTSTPPQFTAITIAPAQLPVTSQAQPTGEIRIDRFLVSGLDFNIEDRTCDPPLEVPLNGLDMEVRDLSSRMPYEDKSCKFNVLLNAGKVQLAGNAVAGAVGDAASVVSGQKVEIKNEIEQRDLFSQVELSGVVSLYPKPKGWVKSSVSGFDLASLRGEARQQGVTLGGGTFDSAISFRLNGSDTIESKSRLSVTDLNVSEPANGPITRFLKLPAPLDVAIAAVQDPDGAINIPLDIPIKSGGVSTGDITGAAAGAIAQVIAVAIASSPLKAGSAVEGLFGGGKDQTKDLPVTLDFDPGQTSLDFADLVRIQPLLKRLREDQSVQLTVRHELGADDVGRASVLANPSPEDCLNLATALREKKMALLAAGNVARQQARAELASGYGTDADAAVAHLRDLNRAFIATEDALDRVYDLLRPGADRQAVRRTKAACLRIGEDRLIALRDLLLTPAIASSGNRIVLAHPTSKAAASARGKIVITIGYIKKE